MSKTVYEPTMPRLVRWCGGRWTSGDGTYRMRWGEMSLRSKGLAFALCLFDEHYSFHLHFLWLNIFVTLPFLSRWHREPQDIMEKWGVSYDHEFGGIHFNWGNRYKIITLPWRNWVQVSHDVMRPDGSWVPYVGSWEVGPPRVVNDKGATLGGKEPDGRHIETHPYRYMLESGEVQERVAECYAERRIRRLRWLRWTPLFQKVTYAISVDFSDEVGERSGSWKGGCVGCGWEMKPGETIYRCLKRMESERRFS